MAMQVACPIVNQRSEKGNDGRAPEDGNMDCVPSALASMARGLNVSLSGVITGDGLHDEVYGQGYVGMQDPARFVAVLAQARYGGDLRLIGPVTGSAQALYGRACSEIAAGRPVLLSIPSDWNASPPSSKYAHMVAGCGVNGNGAQLTAMNPWTAAYQTESAAWWVERLNCCAYKAIWIMERAGVNGGNGAMGVPNGWHDDGKTLTAPNGVQTSGWIRQHVLDAAPQWPAELQPVAGLYGRSSEAGGGWQQEFAASVSVVCTPAGVVSEKAGPDYRAELATAKQTVADLVAEVAQLKSQIASASGSDGDAAKAKAVIEALRVALA
jgi:hypothetical protein